MSVGAVVHRDHMCLHFLAMQVGKALKLQRVARRPLLQDLRPSPAGPITSQLCLAVDVSGRCPLNYKLYAIYIL